MSQKRLFDHGKTLTVDDINQIHADTLPKGPYVGYDVSPNGAGDQVIIAPGLLVLPSGICVTETANRVIDFIPPGPVTNYTVTCRHTDNGLIGGTEALYAVEAGTILSDAVTDGVVLAWIFHPGGAVPLFDDYIVNNVKFELDSLVRSTRDAAPILRSSPFDGSVVTAQGADITVSDGVWVPASKLIVLEVVNAPAAPGQESMVLDLNYLARSDFPPRSIDLYLNVPAPGGVGNNRVQIAVFDTSGSSVSIESGTPINSTSGFELKTVVLERNSGMFAADKMWTIELTFEVLDGYTHRTAWISVNHNQVPDPA